MKIRTALATTLLTAVMISSGFLAGARAASIGLNFVDGREGSGPETLGAGESTGVVPQVNWNNTDANTAGDGGLSGGLTTTSIASPIADTLVDNTGVNSGATVSWAGHTTWSAADDPSPNANDRLMSDYLLTENNTGVDATVSFAGLSYSLYDVYVYFGSNGSGNTGVITLNGGSAVAVTDQLFSNGPFVEATGGGTSGNYVRFGGVSGSNVAIALNADSGGANFHMGIFGVQIVEIPEPSSVALLGLAAPVLLRRRRRK